jgi:hypothetical protein
MPCTTVTPSEDRRPDVEESPREALGRERGRIEDRFKTR